MLFSLKIKSSIEKLLTPILDLTQRATLILICSVTSSQWGADSSNTSLFLVFQIVHIVARGSTSQISFLSFFSVLLFHHKSRLRAELGVTHWVPHQAKIFDHTFQTGWQCSSRWSTDSKCKEQNLQRASSSLLMMPMVKRYSSVLILPKWANQTKHWILYGAQLPQMKSNAELGELVWRV